MKDIGCRKFFLGLLFLFGSQCLQAEDIDRIQITIHTSDLRYSGTDDPVSISLNHSNKTILDYPHDDFEVGSKFTYDLKTESISSLRDIEFIRIIKYGTNELRLDQISLLINGAIVYKKEWSNDGLVLDDEPSEQYLEVTLLPAELNKDRWVIVSSDSTRESILKDELALRLTGLIGSVMKETAATSATSILWKGKAIVLSYIDDTTIKVECFIKRKTSNFIIFNYSDVSFSFLVKVDCNPNTSSSRRLIGLARRGDLDYRRSTPVFQSFPKLLASVLTNSDCALIRCSQRCDLLFR